MGRILRTATDLHGLQFRENGLLPVVTQDDRFEEVPMFAVDNRQALERALRTGETYLWCRSRQELEG